MHHPHLLRTPLANLALHPLGNGRPLSLTARLEP
jgi:hypothetical protein